MKSYHYIEREDIDNYREKHNENIDSSYESMCNIRLLDRDVIKQEHFQELKPGETIVNNYVADIQEITDIGQTVMIFGKSYKVKQIVEDEIVPLLYMCEQDYHQLTSEIKDKSRSFVEITFQDPHIQQEYMLKKANKINELQKKYEYFCYDVIMIDNYGLNIDIQSTSFNIVYIAIIVGIAIVYIYQFIFELWKQSEDIGSYQLLGLTHKEIGSIYFFKSLMIVLIGYVLGIFIYLLEINFKIQSYALFHVAHNFIITYISGLIGLGVVIAVMILSLLPLRNIVQKDAFENKNTRE